MLIDLHAHSHLSMGCDLSPRAVLDRAQSHGLAGVAFTETNTQDGCDELLALGEKSAVLVFVGLELNTDKGQYLCFFPDPDKVADPVQLWGSNRERPWSAEECLPRVKAMGAAIVAARPYDREFSHPMLDHVLALKDTVCAIEGYNARARQVANDLALEAANTLRVRCVGGSDARESVDEVGRGATFFKAPVKTQDDLVTALKTAEYWPVMVGDIPRLSRPGEAREADRSRPKKRNRFRPRPAG
ncbi:MAG: PHP-associated domain-containing protein [Myxococcaceae bacterium]